MAGEANPTTPPPPSNPPAGDGAPGESGEGTPQSEEDRIKAIATAEHAKGTRAGRTGMLRQLGFNTVEEATSWLETARAGQQSQGELEQKATTLAAEVAQLKTQLREEQSTGGITNALVQAGVKPERLTRAMGLVRQDLAGGIEAPDTEGIGMVVAALKGDMPELFGSTTPPPPTIPAPGGMHGGTQPPGTNGQKPPGSEGLAEFERRFKKKTP